MQDCLWLGCLWLLSTTKMFKTKARQECFEGHSHATYDETCTCSHHLQCISQGLTRLGFRESSPYEAMLKGHWPKHHMHMMNA